MKLRTLVLSGLLAAGPFCGAAFAQSNFYLAAAYGQSNYNVKKDVVTQQGAIVQTLDTNDIAFSGTLGYQFNEEWALEASYVDPGRVVFRGAQGSIIGGGSYSLRLHRTLWTTGVNMTYPLGTTKWTANFRFGVSLWEDTYAAKGNFTFPKPKDDGTSYYAGVHLNYWWNPRIGLGAGYDYYDGGRGTETHVITGNVTVKF